jgi:hypothetical protein
MEILNLMFLRSFRSVANVTLLAVMTTALVACGDSATPAATAVAPLAATATVAAPAATATVAAPAATATVAAPAAAGATARDISQAAAHTLAATSYHYDLSAPAVTETVSLVGDTDTVHQITSGTLTKGSNAVMFVTTGAAGFISVDGGTTYLRSDGSDMGSMTSEVEGMLRGIAGMTAADTKVTAAAPERETLDGVAARHLVATDPTGKSPDAIDLWISDATPSLLIQVKLKNGATVTTFKFSQFGKIAPINTPVVVDAPATDMAAPTVAAPLDADPTATP